MNRHEYNAHKSLSESRHAAPRPMPVRRMSPAVVYLGGARWGYWAALAVSVLAFIVR